MNNDELKKKIVDIIQSVKLCTNQAHCDTCEYDKALDNYATDMSCTTLRIADALISAGIGDVKEAERKVKGMVKQNQLLSMALWIVCYEKAGIGMPFKCKHDKCETEMGAPCCRETATDCFIKEAIKQAEKELKEERKDDDLSR